MAITTSGYGVNVLPQAPVVDPRMYAFNPSQILEGANQTLETLGTVDKLRAFKEQQKEQQATRDARIAHIKAISDLAVLQANHEHAIDTAKKTAELAGYGLKTAQDTGSLATLPEEQSLAAAKRGFEGLDVKSKTESYEKDRALADRVKAATAQQLEAEARWRDAEANKANAEAKAGKPTKDEVAIALEKEIGQFAVQAGLPVDTVKELRDSKELNDPKWGGIPIGAEFASLMKIKPDQYANVYEHISPELKAALAGASKKVGLLAPGNIDLSTRPVVHNDDGTVSTLRSISIGTDRGEVLIPTISPDGKQLTNDQAIELFKQTGQHLGVFATPEAATAAAKAISKAQGEKLSPATAKPNVVKVDKDFNIVTPKEEKPKDAAKEEKAQVKEEKEQADHSGIFDAGLVLTQSLKALKNAKTPIEVRAAKRLVGYTLSKFAPMVVPALGRGAGMAVGAATSLPVTAAYEANKYGGQALGALTGKGWEKGENVVGMELRGLNADSMDESTKNAQIDEISQRIRMTMASDRLSEEQKWQEVAKLIDKREMIWTAAERESDNRGNPRGF